MPWFCTRAIIPLVAISLCFVASWATAQPNPDRVDFERQVFPIFQRSCIECHGKQKQEGGLRLDIRAAAERGGDSGPVFRAVTADESELARRIALSKTDREIMPARGNPLSKKEVELIRTWIDQGAPWPDNVQLAKHWSYVKPLRPAIPALPHHSELICNPIDNFILAKVAHENLKPSPRADRATVIRRVSLDLIGLPPTPSEVDSFLADPRLDAYERLVDRLLASPTFGERWARPWLDLARYADSHGFQRDDLRELWAYRDWVVSALNADMPFDQFTIEQIAGDLLPNATEAQKIATGFHRCATINVEMGSEPEETRTNQVIDRVNTTGSVWLGATLECAQCHDHKFDPFTQREYFQLFAYFNNTALEAERADPNVPGSIRFLGPKMTLASMADETKQKEIQSRIAQWERELDPRRKALTFDMDAWIEKELARGKAAIQTHVLEIADFDSSASSPYKMLEDKSVLLVDEAPDRDTYTITVHTQLRGITGFKLEALTDPSLPGNGPGRGDAERPNFVLNSFTVSATPMLEKFDKSTKSLATAATKITLANPQASFSQTQYDVAGAIDNDPKTAWAINPKFHQPHWATFATQQPIGFEGGTTLLFTLVQDFGNGRTIGRLRLSAITGTSSEVALPADIAKIIATPADKRQASQIERLVAFRLDQDPAGKTLREKLEETKNEAKASRPPTTLAMEELPTTRTSFIFSRGDFRSHGEVVQPKTPAVLHAGPTGPPNRLTLARWLIDRDNPLTARVTVNRWWAELFGRGLVSTAEDFGIKGEPPTHPELLDYLATEFLDSNWSTKQVLRTIVLSSTYQQSSKLTPELLVRDPQNEFHARGPRVRLDAETIRDNALAIAGLLNLKRGGPPIRPYQPDGLWTKVGGDPLQYVTSPGEDAYRRGIYVVWKRASPYPSFVNFDATSRLSCTIRRSRSNTPLQALTLLNDPVYVEVAQSLANHVRKTMAGESLSGRLTWAFRTCLGRAPNQSELTVLSQLYESQLAAHPKDDSAAWYAVATTLLNLDETITK